MAVEAQTSFIAEELGEVNKELSEADVTALRINMKLVQNEALAAKVAEFKAAERFIKKCTPALEDGQTTARYKVTDFDGDEPFVIGEIAVKRKNVSAVKAKDASTTTEKSIVSAAPQK